MKRSPELRNEYRRSASVIESSINKESRTVDISFSSETPVEKWGFIEILDHSPDSVRLDRLRNGGAVLKDHDRGIQIGVVESVSIDDDRKCRAVVRFGNSSQAQDEFKDVIDGIRRHVSVGYIIHSWDEVAGTDGDMYTVRATDWEPTEISFVSVPADPTVGVGRQLDKTVNTKPPVKTEKTERSRISDIIASSRYMENIDDLKEEAINKGWSVDEFKSRAYDKFVSERSSYVHPRPVVNKSGFRTLENNFSIVRAVNAFLSGDWSGAGLEREVCQEMSAHHGGQGGIIIPPSVLMHRSSDTDTAGGLVQTEHWDSQWIDTLRAKTISGQLGARFLGGLSGKVSIPKKTASASFGWLSEGSKATESEVTVGNVSLTAKHIGGSVNMTFELMRQSSPAIEMMVRQDLLKGCALAVDKAVFQGSGTNDEPLGVLNQEIQEMEVEEISAPTFEEIVKMEAYLGEENALDGKCGYVARPTMVNVLKRTRKDDGSGLFVVEKGRANDYPIYSTTQMPSDITLFGDFSDVMIGTWGAIELIPVRDAKTGGLEIGCHQLADVAIRNAESFVKTVQVEA
ncbi:phage major capsid protein [Candidatus Sororendozoicomonas aggregata]|uniref:phage major capsid protein n=1 Tax=Candidatus Sororendozoicomonas aggregata TaxID=3073239 RepID=UPI002ED12F47